MNFIRKLEDAFGLLAAFVVIAAGLMYVFFVAFLPRKYGAVLQRMKEGGMKKNDKGKAGRCPACGSRGDIVKVNSGADLVQFRCSRRGCGEFSPFSDRTLWTERRDLLASNGRRW